ncbi:MAG: B12-binding domain-containing radical SAM protein, partial [Bacteroidia bacterium]|nr:B12-binding domain-containing radical SAM protein [Bacteroidia bacterium]
FSIKEDLNEIADFCKDFDIIAFSCYIWNITQTLETAKLIKQKNKNAKILLGGPEVSYDWEDVIAKEQVDYIIYGEGENPFAEFLNNYPDVNLINGLIRKENGQTIANAPGKNFDVKLYEDIMPYASDNPGELRNKVLYIETSRGCPYKCEFCLASLDNKVRYLPDKHIKNTLLHLINNGRVIKFLDRTFNIKKDFTLDIFKFILENKKPDNVFQFEITADILHPDIIKFINEEAPKNLFRFEIGIQTVNQKANLEVSRKQNFEKTKSIIKQVEDKVELHLDLIVGMAYDYMNDIKHSFEEVFKLFAPELQLGFLKFLKGTPVRQKHEQHGFKFDPLPPYQIIESNYLSKNELEQIVNLEHALEVYWNDKRAVNTLKYVCNNYSIFDFLLGLGSYFKKVSDFHKFSLFDIYQILNDYSIKNYPDDIVLKEFIAIDYYLHFKVKPKELILNEIPKTKKFEIIDKLGLNHHQYRFVMLPLSFNFKLAQNQNIIEKTSQTLIIQYNGSSKAELLTEVV